MRTCTLTFKVGITEEKVREYVKENTDGEGILHHFYAKKQIGCNEVAMAIVDLPESSISRVSSDEVRLQPMINFTSNKRTHACDDGGDCCGGGCSP